MSRDDVNEVLRAARRKLADARRALTLANKREASATHVEALHVAQKACEAAQRGVDDARIHVEALEAQAAYLATASGSAPKFCAHCKPRRAQQKTLHALATTAQRALGADRSTSAGENAYELAVAHVLHGLADLLDDGRAAAE